MQWPSLSIVQCAMRRRAKVGVLCYRLCARAARVALLLLPVIRAAPGTAQAGSNSTSVANTGRYSAHQPCITACCDTCAGGALSYGALHNYQKVGHAGCSPCRFLGAFAAATLLCRTLPRALRAQLRGARTRGEYMTPKFQHVARMGLTAVARSRQHQPPGRAVGGGVFR
ncbi:hypothetical protein JKP88DRAFT_24309 [Tribonema minus]|uniref:Uncharacterized protein n=1 Tax=Tribonema minus TaxID=303371 RepID=A0A836CJY3_9STRA|nr:hypothetical protein JKP88DRAFT_24309 [Tribonema minus]